MPEKTSFIGQPRSRVDGRAKVTGAAQFAAESSPERFVHAVIFQSSIAHGKVKRIDVVAAEKAAGVLAVITHENAPRLGRPTHMPGGQSLPVLQGPEIFYSGQHLGVVVAETFEQARHAAGLVRIDYETRPPDVFSARLETAALPASGVTLRGTVAEGGRGDTERALAQAATKIEATYTTPIQHHHAMEAHATVAWWEGERLMLRDATENFVGTAQLLAEVFGLEAEQVVVQAPFTGGSFGGKGQSWPHVIIAALAARVVGRPVKLALTRQQLAWSAGHRSPTIQKLSFGADANGKLIAIRHATLLHTSKLDEFVEPVGQHTELLYSCPNVFVSHRMVRAHVGTPTPTRGPGETPNSFALESGMDELALALQLDPIELRLRNDAATDEHTNRPWSSKALKECYALGAEKFGWARRDPKPRSMRDGRWLIGYGMAATTIGSTFRKAEARGIFEAAEGRLVIQCATHEIGVGNYTILAQIAAESLGLPMERVRIELGDSRFPPTPRGGSPVASSVGSAVLAVARELRQRLLTLAISHEASPLRGLESAELAVENGRVFAKKDPARGATFAEILKRGGLDKMEAKAVAQPGLERGAKKEEAPKPGVYAFHSFGAHFCEVCVDPDLGIVRVARWVSAMDAGRILNPKTARSQVVGGVVWGIGNALMEETVQDVPTGRYLTSTFADYHIATHADVPEVEVHFIEKEDPHVNPLGVKSIGELGNTGSAAAIANAIFHATGRRVRELPITPDKLLG